MACHCQKSPYWWKTSAAKSRLYSQEAGSPLRLRTFQDPVPFLNLSRRCAQSLRKWDTSHEDHWKRNSMQDLNTVDQDEKKASGSRDWYPWSSLMWSGNCRLNGFDQLLPPSKDCRWHPHRAGYILAKSCGQISKSSHSAVGQLLVRSCQRRSMTCLNQRHPWKSWFFFWESSSQSPSNCSAWRCGS